ncbi:MAG: TRAP transporter large permease subunit, partial [bacterium]|nr:TRAP transporter large permease subunit [bacterium]
FGLQVGAPFSWFADTHRGINYGDALLWVLAGGVVLKVLEIVFAAIAAPAVEAAPAPAENDFRSAPQTGPVLLGRLASQGAELIKITWISLESGARNTLVIGCIAPVLGILLSCATQSDLPGRVSALLIEFSFGLLPLTIFWVIVAGYVIGMGLPITASYVILVIFSVVALTNLGVPTITAHLISYWVAVTSAVTPPVALAAYAASAIAMSDPVKTGFQAVKLASWIYIMPFLFVYTPLLLTGTVIDITLTVLACLVGIIAWAGVLEGYIFKPTNKFEWSLLLGSMVCLLLPVDHFLAYFTPLSGEFHYTVYAVGVALLVLAFILQRARGGNVGLVHHEG